jgi:hypothetical protein
VERLTRAHGRTYLDCADCRLVFVDPLHRPSAEAERAHYGTHQNDPVDAGYRGFLDRLRAPLAARLAPGAEGLDYGAGPAPTLSRMLQERGFATAVYDPFFAPDAAVLGRSYDFVTCTETAEHFHAPGDEFARLDALLLPGGWLGVMTETMDDTRDFGTWRYARDPTHVCFYREQTMAWIADRYGWTMETPRAHVFLFRKGKEAR